MTDPTDTSLKAAIERAYDEIQQPKKSRREPLRQKLRCLDDLELFIALCQRAWVEEHPKKVKGIETAARPTVARTRDAGQPQKALRPHVVRAWIEEYRNAANGAMVWFTCPAGYAPFVKALAAAQGEGELDLREETVRRLLLGGATFEAGAMEAVKPLRQSQAASVKRGPGPLKYAIAVITEIDGALTLDDLLEVFEDDDRMEDLYRFTSTPIDITDVEVDRDNEKVRYRSRRQSPTEDPKSVTFKRLKEILAGR